MTMERFSIEAPDGHRIAAYFWPADAPEAREDPAPRGLIQLVHGMAEHAGRYDATASAFAEQGWAVVAHDHRGHGKSCAREADLGHFADAEGWQRVLDDLRQVREEGRARAPDGPLVLLGHSMGSFISLHDQHDTPGTCDALVLSGSDAQGGGLVSAGLALAKLERFRQGPRGKSKLLSFLSFGSFNKGFEGRTEFDWLSRDPEAVDRYIADSRCGFQCTDQLWIDLLEGILGNGRPESLRRLPSDLPIYLLSGDRDPVGKSGVGVRNLERQLKRAGVAHVTRRLWPDARHETLNETNAAEVRTELLAWLAERFP